MTMPDQTQTGVVDMPEDLTQAFWSFKGAMEVRSDHAEKELRAMRHDMRHGFASVEAAIKDDHEGDEQIRTRLTTIETRQSLVYKILGALALIIAGGLFELVRRALVGV